MKLDWVKEDQITFLERGYLEENETLEKRYKEICKNIEKICLSQSNNKESVKYCTGIAKRFEKYIENNWVSFATPVLKNFARKEDHLLPISCVGPETWINTRYGGKMAKNITVGDEVLTHKGNFKAVEKVIKTKDKGDIYKLKVASRMTDLLITGNHEVKTNLGWTRVDALDPKKHLVAVNNLVDFGKEVSYTIDMKDFVYFSYIIRDGMIHKKVERNSDISEEKISLLNNDPEVVTYYTPIPEFVSLDSDVAWMLGLFFADGSISRSNIKKPTGIRLTQGTHEQEFCDRWMEICKNKFNCNSSTYYSDVESKYSKRGRAQWLTVNSNSVTLGAFFDSFGKGALHKKIPSWIIDAPKEIIVSFLEGLFHGDGSLIEGDKYSMTLSNPELVLQAYNLCLKVGFKVSLQMQQKPGKYNKTTWVYKLVLRDYKLSKSRAASNSGVEFNDGLIYCTIKTLEKTDAVLDVYDFTVSEDHSFSCSGVVVHNCNFSYLGDSLSSIYSHLSEKAMLTKAGAGVAVDFSGLRTEGSSISTGGTSNTILDWIELYSDSMSKVAQNSSRRGQLTAYLSVDHPEIYEFLKIATHKMPKDLMRFFATITTAVTIPEGWRDDLKTNTEKKKILSKVLEVRKEKGFPYILDLTNCNENKHQAYKDKNMNITSCNICAECPEFCDDNTTFACCLSSVNAYWFDDWKEDPLFIRDMSIMLDCVIEEYIKKGSKIPEISRAVKFAKEHRATGLGVLGFHSYLQKKSISFGSLPSYAVNKQIFQRLDQETLKASRWMARYWGEPEVLKGYGERATSRTAVAPTKSTAFIMGGETQSYSEGVQPVVSNYTEYKLAKFQATFKNHDLENLLISKNKNTKTTWKSIKKNNGSVQHLDFLSDHEKEVFKTFLELSQYDVISLAAERQKHICMGQSLNIAIHPDIPMKEVIRLHIKSLTLGVKSLYYQYNMNASQKLSQDLLTCSACEG